LHVSNFAEAQNIDAASDFVLNWDQQAVVSTNDLITFSVESATGTVFRTSAILGSSNALNGTASSVRIPANILPVGRTTLGVLTYFKVTGTNYAYGNAAGYAGWFSQTDFPLRTQGSGDSQSPVLVSTDPPASAANVPQDIAFRFTFSEPMRNANSYWVGGTANPTSSSWSADKLTYTVTSSNLWPANTTLTWLLSPAHGTAYFSDAAGNILLPEPSAIFKIGSGTVGTNLTAPTLEQPVRVGSNVVVTAHGQAFRRYRLQRALTPGLTNWVEVQSIYSTNGTASFSTPLDRDAEFFRASVSP
jgi:hypothetical protein